MEEKRQIVRAAGVVGFSTLLSRILGFVRDAVIASTFGAGMAADAFFVAFRIPNLFRRLLGEGSLTSSFIPVFTEYITHKPVTEAKRFANAFVSVLILILGTVVTIGIIFAPQIVALIAHGFSNIPEKYELTVRLTRIMFPYLFFIGLVALSMGILNAMKHFAAPALAPILLNISMIGASLFLSPYFEEPVTALAVGVVLGGSAQLMLQVPFLYRNNIMPIPSWEPLHPGNMTVAGLMAPSIIGLAVTQINVFVDTIVASFLDEGTVSYLYYADRLLEFPMGIFAIAIATAVLPAMSERAAKGDMEGVKENFSYALRLTLFLTIPAMTGLLFIGVPIISFLFQRGSFTAFSTTQTAEALYGFAIGLPAFAGVRIIVPVFYSLQDTKTPVKVGILAMLTNVICDILFMYPLKQFGLSLATSISAMVNFSILAVILKKRLGRIGAKRIAESTARVMAASILMGFTSYLICMSTDWSSAGRDMEKFVVLSSGISAGITVFLLSSYLLKAEEMVLVISLIKRKINKG